MVSRVCQFSLISETLKKKIFTQSNKLIFQICWFSKKAERTFTCCDVRRFAIAWCENIRILMATPWISCVKLIQWNPQKKIYKRWIENWGSVHFLHYANSLMGLSRNPPTIISINLLRRRDRKARQNRGMRGRHHHLQFGDLIYSR